MRTFLILLVFLIIPCCILDAQDPYHINFDVNDGLPSSEVYDVEIDKFNNIWFSTDRGLSRYNGYEFENFTTDNGLTDNTIFEIIKDKDENLWFSCYDGSVCFYDYVSFQEAPFNKQLKSYIDRNWLKQLQFNTDSTCTFFLGKDSSDDGWRCHFKYYFNSDSLVCTEPETTKKYLRIGENDANDFYYISKGHYYTHIANAIDSNTMLLGFTPETNFLLRDRSKDHMKVKHEYDSHIVKIDQHQNETLIFKDQLQLVRIYINQNKDVCLLTDKGLRILKDSDAINDYSSLFTSFSCSSMLEDSENNIWITTINKGVILIPSLGIQEFDNSNFNNSRVLSMVALEDHLVASTFHGDLFSVDKKMRIQHLAKLDNRYIKINKAFNNAYTFDNTQIQETDRGIDITKDQLDKNVYSKVFLKVDEDLFLRSFHSLHWADVQEDGTLLTKENVETNSKPMSLYVDKDKKVWIGTLNGLFWIENYESNRSNAVKVFEDLELGRISTIQESTHGITYLGTIGQGLFFHSYACGGIKKVELEDVRSTKIVNCLYEENDSTLWIGSNNGLFHTKIIITDGTLSLKILNHFNTRNGLSSNFIYSVQKWNDKYWVASEKGINVFSLEDIPSKISAPEVYFDSITTNQQLLDFDHVRPLKHYERNLTFHYSSNSFKKNLYNEFYKYALIRGNKDTLWKYANSRVVQFTNLNPGNYEFIVKSRNQLDNWSSNAAKFKFQILPHFTQTLLFQMSVIVAIILLTYLIYDFRARQVLIREIQKRKLQSTEMRAQRAELDALRGQMNPHFIFNALNSIQNYIYKGDEQSANYYLTRFSKLMRNSLEMSKLALITIEEELKFLKNYLELEQMRFEDKFTYSLTVQEGLDINKHIPPLLIQPLVENCIKHGFKNIEYPGEIEIRIREEDDHIIIDVIDNGMGICTKKKEDMSNSHKSYSIKIIRERLQIINAQNSNFDADLNIESPRIDSGNTLKGTRATIRLPYFNH